jgi:hypothetical protein
MRKFYLACLLALLPACASSPVIVPEGPDTFVAYKQAATGFSGTAPLKIEAMQAAGAHCADLGKKFVVVSTNETPGGALGRYPGAEVHFRCLDEGDKDLKRPTMRPNADTVIEVNHSKQ